MIAIALALLAGASGWTLVCGGDIMLNHLTPSPTRLQAAAPLFTSATVSMANLEIQLTSRRNLTPYKSPEEVKARKQYVLKADPRNSLFLRQWGFKVLTEGNNHAMDYRWEGLSQCLGLLDHLGIRHTGAGENLTSAWRPARVRLPGEGEVSIGAALAFAGMAGAKKCGPATQNGPGVATLFLGGRSGRARLKKLIESLRSHGGPVVLFLHWGVERDQAPRPYQVELGRACIDAGADAVLGAHPHVLQGGELYRGKPILYSLGNLINNSTCEVGIAQLSFTGRSFRGFRFHPFLNRAGVLHRYPASQEKSEKRRFGLLGAQIRARFPSRESHSLESDFAAGAYELGS